MTVQRRRPAGGPGADRLRVSLVERTASGVKPEDLPLPDRVAEFRRQAGDPDWRRRCIRVAVGLDDAAIVVERYEGVLSDLQAVLGLADDLADREMTAVWERHEQAAAGYCAAMVRRLGWLVRSGAPAAAIDGAAIEVDRRFGSPLGPGDYAVLALHFGLEEAERRRGGWRIAIANLTAHARRQRTGGRHGEAA